MTVIIIVTSIIYTIKNKIKNIRKDSLIYSFICFFYIFILILNLLNITEAIQVYYVVRDSLIPFLVLVTIKHVNFNKSEVEKILQRITTILCIQGIFGLVLGVIESLKGWEWTSKFYTGYVFYGNDPLTAIKVNEIGNILRIPSIAGTSVIYGMMGAITVILLLFYEKSRKKKIIFLLISFINILLSTYRTSLVIAIVSVGIYILLKFKPKMRIIILNFATSLLLLGALFGWIVNKITLLSPESLYDRINNTWSIALEELKSFQMFLPLNTYSIGGNANYRLNSNIDIVFSYIDNMFLYILLSFGLIGLILFLILEFKLYKDASTQAYGSIVKVLTICFLIGGMFTNLFQGRSFCIIYFIVVGIILNKENTENVRV